MLVLTTLLVVAPLPQDFPTPHVVIASLGGEFRAHGDFDSDGDVDLLHFAGSITGWTGYCVFTNDGSGHFTPGPVTPFQFPAAYTVGTLRPCVGDFDGDGALDFVIARDGAAAAVGEGIEFFLGDGTGAFPARVLVPIATPRWVAIGDMDGDAALEVAVDNIDANYDRRLGWIDFQGGVPVRLPTLLLTPGAVPMPFVFAVVDGDGDGNDDVVATAAAVQAHDTVQFFPTVAGVPTVGAAFTVPAVMRDVNHRIHAGDLDGDGDRDLLVLQMLPTDVGPNVQVYERTGGGWVQRPVQSVPTPGTGWIQPHATALADWNGDGRLDVLSSSARLDVLRGIGGLAFAEGFEALSTGQREGGGACDVDGDGDPDFVAGNSILLGDGSFTTAAIAALPFVPARIRDLEGDGDLDFDSNGPGSFARNDATGAFAVAGRLFPPASPDSWSAPMAWADFDGNGRPEHLVMRFHQPFPSPMAPFTPLGMWRIEEDGNDGYLAPVAATVAPDVVAAPPGATQGDDPHWGTGDADDDGDVDLLLDGGYRANDGTGMLSVFVAAYTGRGRAVADFDGDGVPDLVSTAYTPPTTTVLVWRGNGAGFTNVFGATVPGRANARFVDLDGDLDLDLAVAATDAAGLHLFENVAGTYATRAPLPFAKVLHLDRIGVGDCDGDGVLDLVVPAQAIGPLSVSYDTVARLHGTGMALGFDRMVDHLTHPIMGLVDIDADGDLDAVGNYLLRSTRAPANHGAVRQYGAGGSGTAGIRPVLGATGPVLSTSSQDELRLVRGTAGAAGVLVFGLVEATLTTPSLPGLFVHVGDPTFVPLPPLGGNPALAGGGELVLPLPNLPLPGLTVVAQVFVVDAAAPSGWAATNGLALTFGP
jgi:hypothetical protein